MFVKPLHKRSWLRGVLTTASATSLQDAWAQMLLAFACHRVGVVTSLGGDLSGLTPSELGLRRWLAEAEVAGLKITAELDEAVLLASILEKLDADECARATVLAISLRKAAERSIGECIGTNWEADNSRQVAEAMVVRVCRRFHLAVKQLGNRHGNRAIVEVKDEYDVQYLLNSLLAVHFDDIRPEEHTPSYGRKSTRMDFLLKQEGIVVEAKMTRPGLSDKEVASQLIDDKERYRVHSDCKTLVCFIYDPTGLIKNPQGLEADLSQDESTLKTIVIVNPTGM